MAHNEIINYLRQLHHDLDTEGEAALRTLRHAYLGPEQAWELELMEALA